MKILKWLASHSGYHRIGTVARVILCGERIKVFLLDPVVIATFPDFQAARAEIRELGIDINQLTKSFNSAQSPAERLSFAMKVAEQYQKVGDKVDQLIPMVSRLQVTPIKGKRKMTLEELFKERGIQL